MNKDEIDGKILDGLLLELDKAQSVYAKYSSSCPSCRMLDDYLIGKFVGVVNPYSQGHKQVGDSIYCVSCNRLIYSDER